MKWLLIFLTLSCYACPNCFEGREFKMRGSHPIHINREFVIKRSRGGSKDNREILREGYILQYLNRVNCQSAPQLLDMGYNCRGLAYIKIEYIESGEEPSAKKIYEAYQEQKHFGVYQGDPNRSNFRYRGGKCILIDYGMGEISPKFIHMNSTEFLRLICKKLHPGVKDKVCVCVIVGGHNSLWEFGHDGL